jgi:hypothetical protein
MKKCIVLLFLSLVLINCKKGNQNAVLTGLFTEVYPFPDSLKLNFINNSYVIVTGTQVINQSNQALDTALYQIDGSKIEFISSSRFQSSINTLWFELEGKDSLILNPCLCLCPCASSSIVLIKK